MTTKLPPSRGRVLFDEDPEYYHFLIRQTVKTVCRVNRLTDDAVGHASLFLLKYLDRYDEERGTAFRTYVINHVRWGFLDFLRTHTALSGDSRTPLRLIAEHQALSLDAEGILDGDPLWSLIAHPTNGKAEEAIDNADFLDLITRRVSLNGSRSVVALWASLREHGPPIREAATRVGLSRAACYYHMNNLRAIINECLTK